MIQQIEAAGGAEAGGSGLDEGGGLFDGFDAAGGFDADLPFGDAAEEFDVFDGGAAEPAGAGFEEVDVGVKAELGGELHFFAAEAGGFEDDFDDAIGAFGDFGDFAVEFFAFALLEPALINDDVEFVGSVFGGVLGFVEFDCGGLGAGGEADDGADFGLFVVELFFGVADVAGGDADAGEFVAIGFGAELGDVLGEGSGVEEGVVDEGGEVDVDELAALYGHGGLGLGVSQPYAIGWS